MSKLVKGIIIAFVIMTMVDAGFLIKYIVVHSSIISKASFARLITFVLTHFYFAFMMGVFYDMDDYHTEDVQIYRYSEWMVNTFVPIAAIDTFIEIGLVILTGAQKGIHTPAIQGENKDQELHLINFYFMTYMYTTIIGVLAAIHLCINKFLERLQKAKYQDVVQEILDRFLIQVDSRDPKLKQAECSICQVEFLHEIQPHSNRTVEVVNLECDHLFHKECILEWVKKTYEESMPSKCPNCRRPIND